MQLQLGLSQSTALAQQVYFCLLGSISGHVSIGRVTVCIIRCRDNYVAWLAITVGEAKNIATQFIWHEC